jgi:hypothetical protein
VMNEACKREIVELHQFFAGWLSGRLEKTAQAFARCADVLAPDFRIIPPRGLMLARADLTAALYDAHGSRSDDADFSIWTEDEAACWDHQGLSLLTYIECQRASGETTKRTSSVLFSGSPTAPNGVVWRHVHETWIVGHEPASGDWASC